MEVAWDVVGHVEREASTIEKMDVETQKECQPNVDHLELDLHLQQWTEIAS